MTTIMTTTPTRCRRSSRRCWKSVRSCGLWLLLLLLMLLMLMLMLMPPPPPLLLLLLLLHDRSLL